MKHRFLSVFLIFCCAQFLPEKMFGQTYTTSGLSSNWTDASAWIKTNPESCGTPNPSNTPPLGPVYASCDIRIIINHPISRPGNANIGGGNVRSITVNQGGEITFGGNLTVNNVGAPAFLFQINDGGRFIVGGTLGIQASATFNVVNSSNTDPKTFVQANNLTFLNSGSGQAVNVGSNTIFNVTNQTRLEGGGTLNIQGEFNTNTFNSANSGGTQVNVSGDGLLRTTGNMQIDGYPLNLSGNAGIVVGGNLTITNSGNSSLNVNGPNTNFTVLTGGSNIAAGKTPSGTCFQTPENGNTCFNSACLEILQISTSGDQYERVYIFKCSASWTVPSDSVDVGTDTLEIIDSFRALTVAGGGGGGRGASAGGGGGGGIVYEEDLPITFGSQLSVIVGNGGLGSTSANSRGGSGGDSQIQGRSGAIGGGGGGSSANDSNSTNRTGNSGGSGGGSSNLNNNENINGGLATTATPPTVVPPDNSTIYGFNGGSSYGSGSNRAGGGGGGAGGAGMAGNRNPPNNIGGNGGIGRSFDISGTSNFYAEGGGGNAAIKGSGGSSIGGSADGAASLRNGTTNTGSGGGATSSGAGGNGGAGIVIIRSVILRVLPVEYLYFNAKYNPTFRSGDLTWATAKEWDNSHFEIERAVNSVKEWETVGLMTGAGYSDQPVEYAYQDKKLPLTGGNIFYRLKQLDFDGDSTYSDTKSVQVEPVVGTTYWRVYPNPTTGDPINLEMLDTGAYGDEEITVKIVSVAGQYDVIEGIFSTQLSSQLSEVLRTKTAGIYTLEISWGVFKEYHKVILRR